MADDVRPPAALPEHACWALLRSTDLGRLAVVVEGQPDIFPVNYVVDGGTVVFRTAAGTKVDAALHGPAVAFEADGIEAPGPGAVAGSAWSVVVHGRAEQVADVDALVGAGSLPLFPAHAGRKGRFLRVLPDAVTGRRFDTAAANGTEVP